MATITAASGGGNWTTGATWVGGVAPTAADDARLAGTSGNVTVDAGALCRSLDCTGYTGTVTHNASSTLNIGDGTAGAGNIALRFVSGMTYNGNNTGNFLFKSTSATTQTIDFASKNMGSVTFDGVGASWQLTGTFAQRSGATNMTLTNGALDTNGQSCTWVALSSSNSNTRSFSLGTSNITITAASSSAWNFTTDTNLTFNPGSSTITFTGAGATLTPGLVGGLRGTVFNNLVFTGGGSVALGSSMARYFVCNNLTVTGTAAKTDIFSFREGNSCIISGTLTLTGNSVTNRMLVESRLWGSTATINAAAVSLANCDFVDITGAGAATWTGTSLGDCGHNSNIIFDAPVTQTRSGAGGNWSTAGNWTSRVPLPQDDVIISSGATGTITADMPRLGRDIDFTGFTGTASMNTVPYMSFGSWTSGSSTTYTGTQTKTFAGRDTHTITSNGKIFSGGIFIDSKAGSYSMLDDLTILGRFTTTSGTLNTNNFNMSSNNSSANFVWNAASTVNVGTSTFTMTNGGSNPWSYQGAVMDASAATLVIADASATSRQISGGGKTYGTLTYTVPGSTGALTITGANTFGNINFSDASNARTLTFPASTTTTITGTFNVNGTAGKLMTVNSSTSGATATLSKPSGVVSADYLSIKDSTATGGAGWYAGTHSTNVSNNTGWAFTAPVPQELSLLLMGVGA